MSEKNKRRVLIKIEKVLGKMRKIIFNKKRNLMCGINNVILMVLIK